MENELVLVELNKYNRVVYSKLGYKFNPEINEIKVRVSDIYIRHTGKYKKEVPISDRIKTCEWCSTKFLIKPSKNKAKFCSKKCRRDWYSNDWSQRDEWKEESRKRAVTILQNGKISKTDSEAQKVLNGILDNMDITYENEYNCLVVAIDNYLPDFNLMVEVMGGYWHVDPRFYQTINYQMQYDRVINDKRKRGIIKSQFNINILYLWEEDLLNNQDLCKELILLYISQKGNLEELNSFNYKYIDSEILIDKKFKPFMDLKTDELHKLFIPLDGKKKSKKQNDKWITFECECCGIETEQLKSRYVINKSHTCSVECKKILQQKDNKKTLGVKVNCDNCGKEKNVTNYMYQDFLDGKRKSFFCDYECRYEWQRENFKGENNPNYKDGVRCK